MLKHCTQCGKEIQSAAANYCYRCGYDFRQRTMPVPQQQTQLTSFDPLRRLSAVIDEQRDWLRRNTLLEPLQEIIDNVSLRTQMERATDIQKQQILAGYQLYTWERAEHSIDQVRHARRMGDAEVALEIKGRDLALEDTIAERAHQRGLERLRAVHQHEQKMMELRAQLELVNAIIQSFNQLRLIQLTAQAEGLADVQQMEMLTQIIQKSFTALTEIDASLIAYQHRLDELGFEDLAGEVRSYDLIEDLVRAVLGRIEKGVVGFGEQSRSNQETGRSS